MQHTSSRTSKSVNCLSFESYERRSTDAESWLMGFLEDGMFSSKTVQKLLGSFVSEEVVIVGIRTV